MKLLVRVLGLSCFCAQAMVEDKQKILHEQALQWKQCKVQHESLSFFQLSTENKPPSSAFTYNYWFLDDEKIAVIQHVCYRDKKSEYTTFNFWLCKVELVKPALHVDSGYVFNLSNQRLVQASPDCLQRRKFIINNERVMIAARCARYARGMNISLAPRTHYIITDDYRHAACISAEGNIIIFSPDLQVELNMNKSLCDAFFCFAKVD